MQKDLTTLQRNWVEGVNLQNLFSEFLPVGNGIYVSEDLFNKIQYELVVKPLGRSQFFVYKDGEKIYEDELDDPWFIIHVHEDYIKHFNKMFGPAFDKKSNM